MNKKKIKPNLKKNKSNQNKGFSKIATITTKSISSAFINFKKNADIYPGTIIYVPREIGQLDGINYAAVVAPIFSSLALSLASLNSIND